MANQLDRKIAVILSGCGHADGTEITEAIATLISLAEVGADFQCFAPDSGNVIEMSKRIARGNVQPLEQLRTEDFDGVVFPGGYGAAKVLSNFAEAGARAKVHPEVARVIKEFHSESKPIGAICIAPHLIALTICRDGKESVELTIGNDAETAGVIEKVGARHTVCAVNDYVSDRDHKVLSTPAYMYGDATPFEVYSGIRRMIFELVEMA